MKFAKTFLATACALSAFSAHSALTFSEAAAGGIPTGPLVFTSINDPMLVTSPISGSIPGVRKAPLGLSETDLYSVITKGGSAMIDFGQEGVSSFSFLWGSPDAYNFVDIDTNGAFDTIYSGTLLGALADPDFNSNGSNANTRVFTIAGTEGTLINSLTFRAEGVAFEVAAAPIPEPETYALMLAGLGVVAFMARRRRAQDQA